MVFSLDLVEQGIPPAIKRAAEADEDGERCPELSGLDELEVARRDVRFLRKLFLSQARALTQPPDIAAQEIELLLRDALHWAAPMLAFRRNSDTKATFAFSASSFPGILHRRAGWFCV